MDSSCVITAQDDVKKLYYLKSMNEQPASQLRFEPGGFRGHDHPRIGDIHQLLHGNRI